MGLSAGRVKVVEGQGSVRVTENVTSFVATNGKLTRPTFNVTW
jgi:hypothetical protein